MLLSTPSDLLPRNLRSAREARRLSQKAAAEALGVSEVTVSNHERGATTPNAAMLAKYAELYGVAARHLQYSESIARRIRDAMGSEPREEPQRPRDLPRELRAEALRFEAECVESGADDEDLSYIRYMLHSPETAALFAGGHDGKPMTTEEARLELDSITSALRLWLKMRIARRAKAGQG